MVLDRYFETGFLSHHQRKRVSSIVALPVLANFVRRTEAAL
jgi:hypothetical protein